MLLTCAHVHKWSKHINERKRRRMIDFLEKQIKKIAWLTINYITQNCVNNKIQCIYFGNSTMSVNLDSKLKDLLSQVRPMLQKSLITQNIILAQCFFYETWFMCWPQNKSCLKCNTTSTHKRRIEKHIQTKQIKSWPVHCPFYFVGALLEQLLAYNMQKN